MAGRPARSRKGRVGRLRVRGVAVQERRGASCHGDFVKPWHKPDDLLLFIELRKRNIEPRTCGYSSPAVPAPR